MRLTMQAYKHHADLYDGYCTACDDITNTGGVEPDAEGYECEVCGGNSVMGIEQALIAGHIDVPDGE